MEFIQINEVVMLIIFIITDNKFTCEIKIKKTRRFFKSYDRTLKLTCSVLALCVAQVA